MARKNAQKNDTLTFNSSTKAVMADVIHENIKEKVNAVREVVTGKSNNEIVLVLQYYDYDVEKAIQAYLEDGAKIALTEWHYSGNKTVKKKRNRKKGAAADASKTPDSISTDSPTPNHGYLANGDIPPDTPTLNGTTYTEPVPIKPLQKVTLQTTPNPAPMLNGGLHTVNGSSSSSNTSSIINNITTTSSSISGDSQNDVESAAKATNDSASAHPQPQRPSHAHHRQQTHSGSHAEKKHLKAERDRTSSTSSIGDSSGTKKPAHHGLERSSKDLHRQTVSLERLKLVFAEEVDKTYKKVKTVFDELRACLNAREASLLKEVDVVKDTGTDVFIMRQGLAADLKVKIDRADRMSETELADLRADIKHFVADRKVDEDLGRLTRFLYDDDSLKANINNFGEVVPVKCSYVQQCQHSLSPVASGLASVHSSILEPSPDTQTVPEKKHSEANSISRNSHLDDKEAHEVAELQRRLKNSLILEGIKVEEFPERPTSAPPASTQSPQKSQRGRPQSGMNRNRNRQPRDPQDRRRNGPNEEPRGGYEQTSAGERVILIGKSTRGTGSISRPGGRGRGRGRGGRGGRGGGIGGSLGPIDDVNEGSSVPQTVGRSPSAGRGGQVDAEGSNFATNGGNGRGSPRKPRENSGSPRRGGGAGRGGRGGSGGGGNPRNSNRQGSPVKSAGGSPTKPMPPTIQETSASSSGNN